MNIKKLKIMKKDYCSIGFGGILVICITIVVCAILLPELFFVALLFVLFCLISPCSDSVDCSVSAPMRSRRRERSDVVDDAHAIKALEYCAGRKIGKKSDLINLCGQSTYDYLKKNGAICEYGDEYEYTKLGEVVRLTYYDMKGMGY